MAVMVFGYDYLIFISTEFIDYISPGFFHCTSYFQLSSQCLEMVKQSINQSLFNSYNFFH